MLGENPDESRAARGQQVAGLTKWAKYGVLAMVVADVAGFLLVQNRMSQPAPDMPSMATDVAVADAKPTLPQDTTFSDPLSKDNLQVAEVVANMDLNPQPVAARMDPLPAPMTIEPLALDTPQASPKVARAMQAALRAPVIPTVRIAELQTSRRANRAFTSAFSSDISTMPQGSRQAPTAGYVAPSAAADAVEMAVTSDMSGGIANPADMQITTAPDQAQSEVPVPAFGGNSEPQQLPLDLPAPSAPEASAPVTGEIPAS